MKRCSVFSGRLSLKAVLFSILIILVCSSAFCGCVSAFDGGGTASNPYLINTASDLKQLAKDVNGGEPYYGKYFKVTSDIDLSGEEWTSIGKLSSDQNICMFMGIFDGDGHTISNLYVNNPSKDYQGLFGCTYNANFRNLNLVNVRVTGNNTVGGLVGCYGCKSGTHFIENCSVSGKVSGKNNRVGGIVGYNYIEGDGTTLTIKDSCFDGTVSSNGDYCVGGIVGINYVYEGGNVNVINCNASGTVSGSNFVGGLVGLYDCRSGTHFIENCSVSGKVSGENNWVGGIVGSNYIDGSSTTLTVKDSCFDGTVIGKGDYCAGGIAGCNEVYEGGKLTVINCNASGTVSGSNSVGGIVGYIYAESGGKTYVKNSIALNSYVNGGSNVGRIVGLIYVNKSDIGIVKLNNNYGWKGMKNTITGKLFTDNIGLNEINGEDLVLSSETPTQTHSNHYHTIGLFIKIFIIVCVAILFLIRKNRRK